MEPEVIAVAGTLLGTIIGGVLSGVVAILQFRHQRQTERTNLLRSKLEEIHALTGEIWLKTIKVPLNDINQDGNSLDGLEENYLLLDKLGLLVVAYCPSAIEAVKKLNDQVKEYNNLLNPALYVRGTESTYDELIDNVRQQVSDNVHQHILDMEETCRDIKMDVAVRVGRLH